MIDDINPFVNNLVVFENKSRENIINYYYLIGIHEVKKKKKVENVTKILQRKNGLPTNRSCFGKPMRRKKRKKGRNL